MTWPTVKLQDISVIKGGGRLKLAGRDFVDAGYPAYGAGGINGYLPVAEFDCDAVILSSIGARCGKCFLAQGKWTSLANTQIIFPDEKKADTRFLWYRLNDEARWPRSGAAQPFIKPADVKSHQLVLPPLEEQKRIAAILDQAHALRRLRRRALDRLNALGQAIFHEMFGDKLTAGVIETAPLAEVVKKGTIVTYGIVQAGPEFSGGVPYIRTGDISNGQIDGSKLRHTDPAIAAKFARSRVECGDIVMSIRATVGTTAVVPEHLHGANLTQGTARISPGSHTTGSYLNSYLQLPQTQAWIQSQVKGATFREITLGRLRELPVVLPSMASQIEFDRRLAHAARIGLLGNDAKLRENDLFTSLQHRAFRGEL